MKLLPNELYNAAFLRTSATGQPKRNRNERRGIVFFLPDKEIPHPIRWFFCGGIESAA